LHSAGIDSRVYRAAADADAVGCATEQGGVAGDAAQLLDDHAALADGRAADQPARCHFLHAAGQHHRAAVEARRARDQLQPAGERRPRRAA